MKKFLFLLLLFSSIAYSQDSDTKFQNWFDFNAGYKLNRQWKIYGDAGYRIVFISNKIHRVYVRSSTSFNINDIFILHGGFGAFETFDSESSVTELRPFQGLEIKWPDNSLFPLNHYFRFEERFFSGKPVSTFLFRARYRLGTAIQFNSALYSPLQLEWFASYGSDIEFQLNEFRGVIGLGYVINNYWKLELNTIFQNVKASSDLFSFNDIVFRFRVYKEFNLN